MGVSTVFVQGQTRSDFPIFDGSGYRRSNRGSPVVISGVASGSAILTDGSSGAPVKAGASFFISREMADSAGGDVNAAVWAVARNNGSTQPVALKGIATNNGVGDADAVYAIASVAAAGGRAYGVFTDVEMEVHTVTITHASPAVVTLTAHGFSSGQEFLLGGGTLPSPLATATRYVVHTVLSTNTFTLALIGTPTTDINTTSDGSGTHYLSGNGVFGLNPVMVNNSHIDFVDTGSQNVSMAGVFVQALAGSGNLNGSGVTIAQSGGQFDTGIKFEAASVVNQTIKDNSSSVTAYYIGGSHTDGIDFTPGTFSGSMIKFPACDTYTPTVAAGTGAFTTASASGRYRRLGKMLFVSVHIAITNVTGGSNGFTFTLPLSLTAAANQCLTGRANAITGKQLLATASTGVNTLFVYYYDVSDPDASGEVYDISGWLEVQ